MGVSLCFLASGYLTLGPNPQAAVACRGVVANGVTASGIQDRVASKEGNYKNLNAVTRRFFLL